MERLLIYYNIYYKMVAFSCQKNDKGIKATTVCSDINVEQKCRQTSMKISVLC